MVVGGALRRLINVSRGSSNTTSGDCPAHTEAGQASGSHTTKMMRGLLQPVADKASGDGATAALGYLLHSSADKASGGSIPGMVGCLPLLLAGNASGELW